MYGRVAAGGGWVKSIKHSIFHFSKKVRPEKGIPLFCFFGFKAGLRQVVQGEERVSPQLKICALSLSSESRPSHFLHAHPFFFPHDTYFKRSMSSCVRPRLSSCMVGSEDRCGKALRSFSQHSSSRLGTSSQILNKEPVLLFSWMFTTPPWMYMQPAWSAEKTDVYIWFHETTDYEFRSELY